MRMSFLSRRAPRTAARPAPLPGRRRPPLPGAAMLAKWAVRTGLPPAWFGWRWIREETLRAHSKRRRDASLDILQPAETASNPLPCNVSDRDELPVDRSWWGFSFHDVPERRSGETALAEIRGGHILWYRDPDRDMEFFPAVLTDDARALKLREIRFKPRHGEVLRAQGPVERVERAVWVTERVYQNYAHWLTAHLPKLLLLNQLGRLDDVLLPRERMPAIDASLRMAGLDPSRFRTFDPNRSLKVDHLTLLDTDRLRPDLLRLVPQAIGTSAFEPGGQRIYISRGDARRRRLVNEDALLPMLEARGFTPVRMETLSFPEQVELMRRTAVLCAPHGAGLSNMLFCPPGTHIVELVTEDFPSPNFYAMACALGHHYWYVRGDGVGEGPRLSRHIRTDPAALDQALTQLERRLC